MPSCTPQGYKLPHSRPTPGFQFVLWDTNARINGLVATDLETLVSEVLYPFPKNAGFADGLFVMTTATQQTTKTT